MTKPGSTGSEDKPASTSFTLTSAALLLSYDLASGSWPCCASSPYPLSLNHAPITSWQCQPSTELALYRLGLLRRGLASIKVFRDASRRETLLQCPPAPSLQSVSERSVNTYLVVLNDKDCNTNQFNPININDSVPGDTRISEMCS